MFDHPGHHLSFCVSSVFPDCNLIFDPLHTQPPRLSLPSSPPRPLCAPAGRGRGGVFEPQDPAGGGGAGPCSREAGHRPAETGRGREDGRREREVRVGSITQGDSLPITPSNLNSLVPKTKFTNAVTVTSD